MGSPLPCHAGDSPADDPRADAQGEPSEDDGRWFFGARLAGGDAVITGIQDFDEPAYKYEYPVAGISIWAARGGARSHARWLTTLDFAFGPARADPGGPLLEGSLLMGVQLLQAPEAPYSFLLEIEGGLSYWGLAELSAQNVGSISMPMVAAAVGIGVRWTHLDLLVRVHGDTLIFASAAYATAGLGLSY